MHAVGAMARVFLWSLYDAGATARVVVWCIESARCAYSLACQEANEQYSQAQRVSYVSRH